MENQTTVPQATPPAAIPAVPRLNRDAFFTALSSPPRLAILAAMCDGEPYCTADLVPISGSNASNTSRHVGVLLAAGILVRKGARLYRIDRRFLPVPGQRILEFGHCLLRLDTPPA